MKRPERNIDNLWSFELQKPSPEQTDFYAVAAILAEVYLVYVRGRHTEGSVFLCHVCDRNGEYNPIERPMALRRESLRVLPMQVMALLVPPGTSSNQSIEQGEVIAT